MKRVRRVYSFSYHYLITSFGRVREFILLTRLALGQVQPRLTDGSAAFRHNRRVVLCILSFFIPSYIMGMSLCNVDMTIPIHF